MLVRSPLFGAVCGALALAALVAPPARALTAQHRLEHAVVPAEERLRLELDARKSDYRGTATIELRVTAATDSFQFHDLGPKLGTMTLSGPGGPVTLTSRAEPHGVVTARASRPLAPGDYTLEIAFTNEFGTRADGLYKLVAGGESYVVSQFEAISARQAFPCWDEPEFKIPWQLTLVVPRGHAAISNTPIARDSTIGESRTVEFEPSPPLPSYLVAIVTGPWETVPVAGMTVPVRIVAPKGTSQLAGMAVRETPKILSALEAYFGRPYPYKKLDLVAVPEFWAGAMENAGAVTFRDRIVLVDPTEASSEERRHFIAVTAHELAHMWFGDLVTMRWWNDVWLNESFASWLGDKVTQQVAPEFDMPVEELVGTQRAMERDAQASTRAMRADVDGFGNMDELFDELAYQKGEAVLGMIEQWIGPDTFKTGVRAYVTDHAWGNAEGADLWNALSKASGHDVSKTVTSFLDNPGVPVVTGLVRDDGRVQLGLERFYNQGDPAPVIPDWRVPVTIRYGSGKTSFTHTIMMSKGEQFVQIGDAPKIDWLHLNLEERGYYRWQLHTDLRWALVDRAATIMSPRERMGLVNNLGAGIEGGFLQVDEALQMFSRLVADPRPEVSGAVLDALDRIRLRLIAPEFERGFAEYLRRYVGPVLQRYGAAPVKGERPAATALRGRLMLWLGAYGHDAGVVAGARTRAAAWMRDPAAVHPSLVESSLRLAALDGDSARFGQYQRRFEHARTPVERARLLNALGSFRDSTLVERALDYSLSDAVRPNEMYSIWMAVNQMDENRERSYRWMTRRYDALAKRLPPYAQPFLIRFAAGCSPERLESAKAFFTPERRGPGFDVELARVEDELRQCSTLRQHQHNTLANYLETLSAPR